MDTEKGAFAGFAASLKAELEPQHADLLLFACCLTSGLVDSTIYNAYNTFVSMQTGNTIFVGLGASNQNARPYGWARSLTSIGCFVLGCFLFARLHSALGARRRGCLMMSFMLQTSIIILTAGLVEGGAISSALGDRLAQTAPPWDQEVPIVLLSIQSAGQIVASRALGFNEIPTVVITSLLCDLVSDPKLFLIRNQKRDRRVIAFVLTLLGAIIGGWVTKATQAISPTLWLSAGIKAVVVLAWGLWKAK
ncbi:hypothetical protein N7499_010281 [Penicillium canescens]|uniref:DUF1275 domain protein n=1 Tax=Penicillium canescens TaxID=5083 RepID=A0AAD6IHT9_PENCN|nr:uncharacterized protein N7446_005432 [Penicillium canescens]KAJ5989748.1 hypothetical protein N7522_009955 [Penicillium canescens]KAJ6050328.1 hypothetical protein N7444_007044 [Penicillium canescens]KAJ6050808.1 hypothetical protein N7460_001342 [Penicillium canescens]KAJ6061312.1 hypothetical protein N7446_005432 [Penicillium canescens]KAJ6068394.1 hypothetical protein N7499_010281 [Penicillium canescens]